MSVKQEEIYKKAYELFKKYGIKSITMDEIASKVGISKKTLYTIFEDKLDLIVKIIDAENIRIFNEIDSLFKEKNNAVLLFIKIFTKAWVEVSQISPVLYYDLKKYYPSICQNDNERTIREGEKFMKNLLEQGIKEGFFNERIDVDFISKVMIINFTTTLDNDAISKEVIEENQFKQLLGYHLRAILSSKGLIVFQEEVEKLQKQYNLKEILTSLKGIEIYNKEIQIIQNS